MMTSFKAAACNIIIRKLTSRNPFTLVAAACSAGSGMVQVARHSVNKIIAWNTKKTPIMSGEAARLSVSKFQRTLQNRSRGVQNRLKFRDSVPTASKVRYLV